MTKTIAEDAAQLARDLDKAPSGEVVLERLLSGMALLMREHRELKAGHAELRAQNAELRAQNEQILDQLLDLTKVVDSAHAAILQLKGQRHQDGGGLVH